MVGTGMLCGNGRSLSGRYHGRHMDALWERTEFVWTLAWWAHGCSVGTDGVGLDVIMVGTWMLCGNGRTLSGTLSWLAHGCSVGTDGVGLDVIMVGTWMLCGNGRSLSGRYHGWHMDALWERTEFVWTLSWLAHGCSVTEFVWTLSWSAHGCSVGTDGVCLDVIMVGTWMLCGIGRSFVWTLSWLAHGCSVGTDGVGLDVIMVGTGMLCGNGRSLSGRYHGCTWMLCGNGRSLSGRYHGRHMDALWERTESVWTLSWLAHGCSVGTDGLCLERYHGWHMDALWERTEFVWTLSWLAHGCSVGTDGIWLNVIMVGTWMLCGNGRSLSGRYHGWHMDALWERTEFAWTLSWLAHGCSMGTDGVCLDVIMVGTWMLCGNGRSWSGRYHARHMDALWERTEFVWNVIMVGTWMLCGNGRSWSGRYHGRHMDALWERTEFVWNVIMVGTWMLCGNGRSWSGRYHGWHMDALALWERTEFGWNLD